MALLLPQESASIDVIARDAGIGTGTLERWREDATGIWMNPEAQAIFARIRARASSPGIMRASPQSTSSLGLLARLAASLWVWRS